MVLSIPLWRAMILAAQCLCLSPSSCGTARPSRVLFGPAPGLIAKLCSQAPVLSQRAETQAHLARNLAPVVPRVAVCPLPHCVPGLACKLEIASLPPSAYVTPVRDHEASWLPLWPQRVSGNRTPAPSVPLRRGPDWWWITSDGVVLVTGRKPFNTQKRESLIFRKLGKLCLLKLYLSQGWTWTLESWWMNSLYRSTENEGDVPA